VNSPDDLEAQTCPHGYFNHSEYNRCPECYGINLHNSDAVPVNGPGNGWLLKKGDRPCIECGGPATAGHGLIPNKPWWKIFTTKKTWKKQVLAKAEQCWTCYAYGEKGIFKQVTDDKLKGLG